MEPATVAGLVAAEQVVSTTLEVGVPAAYALSRPTLPLSANFTRITSPDFLPRCYHTCCVIKKRAYLYGGEDENGNLASGDVHIVTLPVPLKKGRADDGSADYKCVPPLGEEVERAKVGEEDQGGEDELGAGQVEGHLVEGDVPAPRKGHSAVSIGRMMYMYGGRDENGRAIEEKVQSRVWAFDTKSLRWSAIDPSNSRTSDVPVDRWGHACAASELPAAEPTPQPAAETSSLGDKIRKRAGSVAESVVGLVKGKPDESGLPAHGTLIIYGGINNEDEFLSDAWAFDVAEKRWTKLPSPPIDGEPFPGTGRLAIIRSQLFLIDHPDPSSGGEMLSLQLTFPTHKQGSDSNPEKEQQHQLNSGIPQPQPEPQTWHKYSFPTNPLTPGPLPRQGAALLPISIGHGRNYFLYAFGAATQSSASEYHSTVYAYQPSSQPASAAALKDTTREKLGASSDEGSWAEVGVVANEEAGGDGEEGKAHPGPRGWFASAALEEGGEAGVVVWGGKNAKGSVEGDGWIVSVKGP